MLSQSLRFYKRSDVSLVVCTYLLSVVQRKIQPLDSVIVRFAETCTVSHENKQLNIYPEATNSKRSGNTWVARPKDALHAQLPKLNPGDQYQRFLGEEMSLRSPNCGQVIPVSVNRVTANHMSTCTATERRKKLKSNLLGKFFHYRPSVRDYRTIEKETAHSTI